MPKAYEAMRDKFISDGMSEADAKTKAAKIYNSQHPNNPMHGGMHEKKKSPYKHYMDSMK